MALLNTADLDKLSYEIFSILENKFLFDSISQQQTPIKTDPQNTLQNPNHRQFNYGAGGKVRILSIDATSDVLSAAEAIARLESTLRSLPGLSTATISDFFDAAAGSGPGGVLAAMLFTKRPSDNRPLFSGEEALEFFSRNEIFSGERTGIMGKFSKQSRNKTFRKIFPDELTLKDAIKPLLIPCYDLVTGSPFVFSRSDAVETDAYDFKMREVCSATCSDRTAEMASADGRTAIAAVGNGIVMSNPTAAVVTHVLNNKIEFPLVNGVDDLLVLSLGNGDDISVNFNGHDMAFSAPSRKQVLRIAGNSAADTVDQAVAMAFGDNATNGYVRIQTSGFLLGDKKKSLRSKAKETLLQYNVESMLFQGKKISRMTNGEKLDKFCLELVKELERRKACKVANVLVKQGMIPRSSSMASSTAFTGSTSS